MFTFSIVAHTLPLCLLSTGKACYMLVLGAQEAETNDETPVVYDITVAVRQPALGCIDVVTAATNKADNGIDGTVFPHPLPYVAAHVVESVSVGHLLSNRMRYVVAVVIVPAHLVQVVAS